MRAVLQRVRSATVRVAGEDVGSIGPGLLVYLGIADDDGVGDAAWMARKLAQLRLFEGEDGRLDRSLADRLRSGEPTAALVISQFTLLADIRKGRRPSFTRAAPPDRAAPLCDAVVGALRAEGIEVATGSFGARMLVESENDGPVTLWLDSAHAVRRPGAETAAGER
ncbi:MAG: D-aminoacyl-tRNA deacylase [Chloroflexi bacterium]|nr:D-aminoacyl-tRNA deacylase [Chloroflexota bacterium]